MKSICSFIVFIFLFGCAGNNAAIRSEVARGNTQAPQPRPKTEFRNVTHFIIFQSEPSGADIIVIDNKTGGEVQGLGKTPMRILLMTKKMEVELGTGRIISISDVVANAPGLTYGATKVEGAEFQFKFRSTGFNDELRVERISMYSGDSEATVNIKMVPMKK